MFVCLFYFKVGVNSFSKRDPQAQDPKPKKLTGQRITESQKDRTGKAMQTGQCHYTSPDTEYILYRIFSRNYDMP